MKNWLKKNMQSICNICLGFYFVYHISGFSIGLFGEPELPTDD